MDFSTSYPYKISKINIDIENFKALERKPNTYQKYAINRIEQDQNIELYIVFESSKPGVKIDDKCDGYFAQISLYVYNKEKDQFQDTIILAKKSFWTMAMNSGDIMLISNYSSVVYFDKSHLITCIITKFRNSKIHSLYHINNVNDGDFSPINYQWTDGFFHLND